LKNQTKNILVAPLNWGLGHATRCIPIIQELEKNGFNPIIASDGVALSLLRKEFPHLTTIELPSYDIEYAKKGENFKWKLIKNSPKTIYAILQEKQQIKKIVKEHQLAGIISDNRLGVHSKKVPSVFITHQLTVLSGKTTWISSKLHQHFISKFTECWIPDVNEIPNLTGKLGHLKSTKLKLTYIGILSRLQKKELPIKYQLMVILSGPEPQRTFLEEKLITELEKTEQIKNITFYNFMQTEQLEQTFNESEIVLCRSGYTTVMDLAKLQKKAFFIPTPGQFEQEYLAKKYKKEGLVPSSRQEKFKLDGLLLVQLYNGLPNIKQEVNWKQLFHLFESE
jgi:predicted glycosyltransferase